MWHLGRDWGDAPTSLEMPSATRNCKRLGTGESLLDGVFGGNPALPIPWFQTPRLRHHEAIPFCLVRWHNICGNLLQQPQATDPQRIRGWGWDTWWFLKMWWIRATWICDGCCFTGIPPPTPTPILACVGTWERTSCLEIEEAISVTLNYFSFLP